jgi:nicotinamidase-related amidase
MALTHTLSKKEIFMLTSDNTALILIDVQGKLAQIMEDSADMFRAQAIMIQAAKALSVPILWAEQLPHKLGPTVPEVAEHLSDYSPISKSCFSCAANNEFNTALKACGKRQLLVMGIEAHICVTQSVLNFLENGYEVHMISDAISARIPANKDIGLRRCEKAGAVISSTEMALFELMRDATHEQFRAIQSLIK